MAQEFLLPKARNTVTGQTVKQQDLTGGRFTTAQRDLAQQQANTLAENMTLRTGDVWQGFVESYEPTYRRS